MRTVRLLVFILMLGAAGAHAVDPTHFEDPQLEARYRALTHELRCMQCQNQSLADSPVSLAADLRREVRDMLLAGKSDEEIRQFMVDRYGEFILFRPRFSARNAWLWLAPALMLVAGVLVAVRIVRERSRLADEDDDAEPVEESGPPR